MLVTFCFALWYDQGIVGDQVHCINRDLYCLCIALLWLGSWTRVVVLSAVSVISALTHWHTTFYNTWHTYKY